MASCQSPTCAAKRIRALARQRRPIFPYAPVVRGRVQLSAASSRMARLRNKLLRNCRGATSYRSCSGSKTLPPGISAFSRPSPTAGAAASWSFRFKTSSTSARERPKTTSPSPCPGGVRPRHAAIQSPLPLRLPWHRRSSARGGGGAGPRRSHPAVPHRTRRRFRFCG